MVRAANFYICGPCRAAKRCEFSLSEDNSQPTTKHNPHVTRNGAVSTPPAEGMVGTPPAEGGVGGKFQNFVFFPHVGKSSADRILGWSLSRELSRHSFGPRWGIPGPIGFRDPCYMPPLALAIPLFNLKVPFLH